MRGIETVWYSRQEEVECPIMPQDMQKPRFPSKLKGWVKPSTVTSVGKFCVRSSKTQMRANPALTRLWVKSSVPRKVPIASPIFSKIRGLKNSRGRSSSLIQTGDMAVLRAIAGLNRGFHGCRDKKDPLMKLGPLSMAFDRSSMAKNLTTKKPLSMLMIEGTVFRFQSFTIFPTRDSLEILRPQRRTTTDSDQGALMSFLSDSEMETEGFGSVLRGGW